MSMATMQTTRNSLNVQEKYNFEWGLFRATIFTVGELLRK
jgi:hypothetical protein